ncbi:MAG TPA: glycosyltransferase family 2 protein [Segetibacter sp.]|jgi:dolichol-phosphate mannosyltransferase
MNKVVSLVVPVFNEEKNISALVKAIDDIFVNLQYRYYIIFVDDGSTDDTLSLIKNLSSSSPSIKYISFSRNFGKDNALKAGLDITDADLAITIDADLQHPPELIPRMIELWEEGTNVVYAYRKERNQHSGIFHQFYSYLFYKLLNYLSGLNLEQGIADFRLLDKKVVDVIKGISENEIFLRGLIKWFGFKQTGIAYTPTKRYSGKTTYSKKSLVRLALRGITSFSTRPLYTAAYLGFVISCLSILYLPYAVISYLKGFAISGWASVIVTIAFFGGLQLMILGIMGLYLGKIFMQTKHRPLYIIKELNV